MNTMVLLGEDFNRYMPCLLLIVVAGTLTDFFPKLLSKCGLDVVAFSSCNDDPDRIQEGTDLLRQERSTRERSRRHLYAINPLRNLEDVEESSA
ncbi:hypothetical protein DIPPA_15907 [Diplonema papillatum]|nr:hypothetical protein DIPPA_15907 [Diplonema papillatum]|eukprot:gene2740-4267_t